MTHSFGGMVVAMPFRATAGLLLALLAVDEEAKASGSSSVEAVSGPVRITMATPSIEFADSGDEREFHTSWRSEAQVVIDGAIARVTAEVASWKKKERRLLIPWSPDLRLAQSWAAPTDAWSLTASPGPVSYSAPAAMPGAPPMTVAMIEIAFAEPPPKDVADALVALLNDALLAAPED